jgi:hypothetical protein
VWDARVDGRELHFQLYGINNQNFIMRDRETGSWWQQVTGEAIFGPLAGRRLEPVLHDELAFSTWRAERPDGRVLRPDDDTPWREDSEDWESRVASLPTVSPASPDDVLRPRDLVVGITSGGAAKAYPFDALLRDAPVVDRVGDTPVVLVVADDKVSVRAFQADAGGRPVELFRKADAASLTLVDSGTGSEWDLTGRAVAGPLSGTQLRQIPLLKDYWFDWKTYHPDTAVYAR